MRGRERARRPVFLTVVTVTVILRSAHSTLRVHSILVLSLPLLLLLYFFNAPERALSLFLVRLAVRALCARFDRLGWVKWRCASVCAVCCLAFLLSPIPMYTAHNDRIKICIEICYFIFIFFAFFFFFFFIERMCLRVCVLASRGHIRHKTAHDSVTRHAGRVCLLCSH